MQSAVSGLTKQDAPSAALVPGGRTRHCAAFTQRYCEYIPPPSVATVLPSSAWAAADVPASTTTPAPSLPTGIDSSTRPAMAFMSPSGTLAVTTGRSAVPDCRAVLMSAAPNSSPRSEGLIGAASTRISTSSGPGSGTGTLTSESSSSPLLFMSERSCSATSAFFDSTAFASGCFDVDYTTVEPVFRKGASGHRAIRLLTTAPPFAALAGCSLLACLLIKQPMTTTSTQTILITGASTGIGRASTLALLAEGFRVFAAVRSPQAADELRGAASADGASRLDTLELDVTNAEQIRSAVARVGASVGASGLWGLFNNAGISVSGPVEYVPVDSFRRQFEVNVIGQVAVTQACLPLLRKARGRILTTGSIAGFFATPALAPYSMSKYAIESFNDALRRELRPFGIEVSLLEPGAIATEIWRKALQVFR